MANHGPFSRPLYEMSVLTGLCLFNREGYFSIALLFYASAAIGAFSTIGLYYRFKVALVHTNYFEFDIFTHLLPTVAFLAKISTCLIHVVVCALSRKDLESVFRCLRVKKEPVSVGNLKSEVGLLGGIWIMTFHMLRIFNWPQYLDEYKFLHFVDSASVTYFTLLCFRINEQFCFLLATGQNLIDDLLRELNDWNLFVDDQHLMVVEAFQRVNDLYGVQTLVNIMQAFSYLLTYMYYIATAETFGGEPLHLKALLGHIVIETYMIYRLASSCEDSALKVSYCVFSLLFHAYQVCVK